LRYPPRRNCRDRKCDQPRWRFQDEPNHVPQGAGRIPLEIHRVRSLAGAHAAALRFRG
jgi:hypothetical protein